MMKKIVGIFVIMLLIATTLPVVGLLNDDSEYLEYHNKSEGDRAETWFETQKLILTDGSAEDHFGYSVSISGDYAIVGAPTKENGGWFYIFERTEGDWIEVFNGHSYNANKELGYSVSIDGDYAIVGDPYCDISGVVFAGVAYTLFRNETTGWEVDSILYAASDYSTGDHFGWSVAIDNDYAIVGAIGKDNNGANSGSAYIFKQVGTSWYEQAKLLPADGVAEDYFGYSVSLNGDYALIGAIHDDDNGEDSGSVYVFTRSGTTWTEQAKLTPLDGTPWSLFGYSISINGDTALIGAWWDNDNGFHSGSVYVFTRSGTSWTEQAKLTPSDGTTYDCFGKSVSLEGDIALIGSIDDDNGEDSGSVYVFTRSGTTWTEQTKLLAKDGEAGDGFSSSVSLDGDTAIIGSAWDDDNGDSSGSSYIFERNRAPATPTIEGPQNGVQGNSYTYNFSTTDTNQHQVEYYIEWGDGNSEGWYGPFDSGVTQSWSHTWTTVDTFTIRCKARDELGEESDWGELQIIMPKNKTFNNNFKMFERFFERFPLLERLLCLIRLI